MHVYIYIWKHIFTYICNINNQRKGFNLQYQLGSEHGRAQGRVDSKG